MKTFNEILEAKRFETKSFDSVNSSAEEEANKYAASIYSNQADQLVKNVEEIVDWCFLDIKRKEIRDLSKIDGWNWRRKNETLKHYASFGSSSQNEAGIRLFLKMKFPIKNKISDLEVVVGDAPEYAFYVDLIFNTTGNKAYTSVWTMNGEKIFGLTDTTEMGYIVEKIHKLTPKDKEKFHRVLS